MVRLLMFCFIALLTCSCDRTSPNPVAKGEKGSDVKEIVKERNDSDPKWLYQNTPRSKVAVVFVHGFIGDTITTWQSEDNDKKKTDFYKYLDSAPELKGKLDYFAFGFTSKILAQGSLNVLEAADKMRSNLQVNGVLDYPTIVFVTHSMGGLVTMRFLINNRDLTAGKVPLLVMYAAPQEGSDIGNIAKHLTQNRAIDQLTAGDGNTFILALEQDWSNRESKPVVKCGYETKDTFAVRIVTRLSATRFCGGKAEPIEDADHLSIVKPDRVNHPSVNLLRAALQEHVIGKQLASKLEMPDFEIDGDHLKLPIAEDHTTVRIVNAGARPMRYWIKSLTPQDAIVFRPFETPRSLPGNATDTISVDFSSRVFRYIDPANEFSFVLETDSEGKEKQKVVIEVNRDKLKKTLTAAYERTQEVLTQAVKKEADTMVDGLGTGGKRPELADLAYDAVAKTNKNVEKMPESARWLATADFLANAGMSDAATVALQRAENKDSKAVDLPSAQAIAKQIAIDTGNSKVFKSRIIEISPGEKETFVRGKDLRRDLDGLDTLARELGRISEYQKDAIRVQREVGQFRISDTPGSKKSGDITTKEFRQPSFPDIDTPYKTLRPVPEQNGQITFPKARELPNLDAMRDRPTAPKESPKEVRP
jgi:pimeloyl-ACP methyl ester carboxylesterase